MDKCCNTCRYKHPISDFCEQLGIYLWKLNPVAANGVESFCCSEYCKKDNESDAKPDNAE